MIELKAGYRAFNIFLYAVLIGATILGFWSIHSN